MIKKIPVQIGDIVWVHLFVGTQRNTMLKNGYVVKIVKDPKGKPVDYQVQLFDDPDYGDWNIVCCYWSGYDINWGLVK